MSRAKVRGKSFKLPEVEKRPPSNKFRQYIKAGMAKPGPPLGPILGAFGVNIAAFCKDFNKKTAHYIQGITLPCNITVNADRTCKIDISCPTTKYYLTQAAGVTSHMRNADEIIGKVTLKHVYEIAKIKHSDPHSYKQLFDIKEVCEQIISVARTYGIEVVRDLDPEEYKVFLKDRKEKIEELKAKLKAETEAKLMNA